MMDEMQQLRLANRQMIAERQTLLAERDRYKQLIAQRSANVAVEAIEGLEQMAVQAAGGDEAARAVIARLAVIISRAPALATGILLPNGN